MFKQILSKLLEKTSNPISQDKVRVSIFKAENKIWYIVRNWIFLPFLFATLFSLPLYVNIFTYINKLYSPYINALLALIAIFIYINIDRKFRFMFGFFIGILWFYWIGLSFRFTPAPHFLYIVSIAIGIVYGFVLFFALFFQNILFRIITLSLMSYLVILGFDWFVPDSMLAYSIFKVDKLSFCAIVIIIAIVSLKWLRFYRFIVLAALILFIDFNTTKAELPNTKINITQTKIPQRIKWQDVNLDSIEEYNYKIIEDSINKGYDLVVLPETSIPITINIKNDTIERLSNLSKKIDIVIGAARTDSIGVYNTTYVFKKGKYNFVDKIYLAPFGEYMPIPITLLDIFGKISGLHYNNTFNKYNIPPQNLVAGNIFFRNAICYEATTRAMYEDNPQYMIVTSNNAWFEPSIMSILQMMLIKYYSRLYGTIVFHSTNYSKSMTIMPNNNLNIIAKGF
ncbi:MAG: apolipoprotein N-acyltransferase [Helicobacteraceae bacterium]|nr:apolipoprotein N-acyltransferase [Helicobacteraceae bacterium]